MSTRDDNQSMVNPSAEWMESQRLSQGKRQAEPVALSTEEPYCLLCEKEGHRTDECWSTHGLNSPRDNELFRLARLATPTHERAAPAPTERTGWELAPKFVAKCPICHKMVPGELNEYEESLIRCDNPACRSNGGPDDVARPAASPSQPVAAEGVTELLRDVEAYMVNQPAVWTVLRLLNRVRAALSGSAESKKGE